MALRYGFTSQTVYLEQLQGKQWTDEVELSHSTPSLEILHSERAQLAAWV